VAQSQPKGIQLLQPDVGMQYPQYPSHSVTTTSMAATSQSAPSDTSSNGHDNRCVHWEGCLLNNS
jgi:hypothetical protein